MFTIRRLTAAVAMLAVAIAAGTSLAGPPATGNPTTLTMGTPSAEGRPASRLATMFAARVKALSNGKIAIRVVHNATGDDAGIHGTPRLRKLLGLIRSGELQLATIWAPSLELAGVKTFRAYQVPFQLTTRQSASRTTTGPAADAAMRGLGTAGLVGLATVPQGLNRLFRVGKPILEPSDLTGARIRTNYGPSSFAALRSLGAIPNDLEGGSFSTGLANGSIDGFEAPYEIASIFSAPSKATAGNLVLYPTLSVIAANAPAFARLAPAQRALLQRAAIDARSAALAAWNDTRDAHRFCGPGRWNVRASASQQAAMARLGARASAVYRRDPATAAVMRAIETQKPTGNASTTPCGTRSAAIGNPAHGKATLPPSGSYRLTITAAEMRNAGATAEQIRVNAGTHTMVISGSQGTTSKAEGDFTYSCGFSLVLAGSLVNQRYDARSICAGGDTFFTWWLQGRDLAIRWRDDRKQPFTGADALFNGVWKRVN